MSDNDNSLLPRGDGPEEETFSESLGGYPALVLFVAVLAVMILVFAFPTPGNPSATVPTEVAAVVETEEAIVAVVTEEVVIAEATEEAMVVEATEEVVVAEATEEAVFDESAVVIEFGNLEDGTEVTSPFTVEMVAEGIDVVPAGEIVEGTGHFHVLIDVPFVPAGEIVPADENHLHFGDGSTEATFDLPAGVYTLRLQFADGSHAAYDAEIYGDEATILVFPSAAAQAPTEGITETLDEAIDETVEEAEEAVAAAEDVLEEVVEVTEEAVVEATEEAVAAVTEEAVMEATEEAVAAVTEEAVMEATEEAAADPIAAAIAAGDVELGQQIFNQQYNTAVGPWICASCHSVSEDQLRLVGPGLWGLREHGEERIAETGDPDIPTYTYNSIVNPMEYIVPADSGGPYPENLMPPNYAEILTEEELDALVAYILTLGES